MDKVSVRNDLPCLIYNHDGCFGFYVFGHMSREDAIQKMMKSNRLKSNIDLDCFQEDLTAGNIEHDCIYIRYGMADEDNSEFDFMFLESEEPKHTYTMVTKIHWEI